MAGVSIALLFMVFPASEGSTGLHLTSSTNIGCGYCSHGHKSLLASVPGHDARAGAHPISKYPTSWGPSSGEPWSCQPLLGWEGGTARRKGSALGPGHPAPLLLPGSFSSQPQDSQSGFPSVALRKDQPFPEAGRRQGNITWAADD